MRKETKRRSLGVKDTENIAKELIVRLVNRKYEPAGATIIYLSGELGAGKTTFVKAFARTLRMNIKLSSPTFTIMKKYPLKSLKNFRWLFHLDAYRLNDEKELLLLGWKEIISDPRNLVFIEWPENVPGILPSDCIDIHIAHGEKDERFFRLKWLMGV